jgi:hypothetical protein
LQSVKPLDIADSEPVDWIVQRIIPLYPSKRESCSRFGGDIKGEALGSSVLDLPPLLQRPRGQATKRPCQTRTPPRRAPVSRPRASTSGSRI